MLPSVIGHVGKLVPGIQFGTERRVIRDQICTTFNSQSVCLFDVIAP